MKQEPKDKLYCHECGAAVTEKKLAKGKAVRREGVVYCRKCFRREFPRECRNHPGKPADAPCAMCGKPFCNDCLVKVVGKRVCERCKKTILAMIEKGEDPLKTGALDPSKRPWEKVLPGDLHEIAIRVLPGWSFFLSVLAVVCVLAAACFSIILQVIAGLLMYGSPIALVGIWVASARAQVRLVRINRQGIEGVTGNRRTLTVPWDSVTRVSIGKHVIVVRGYSWTRPIRIRKSMYLRYHLIADVLREACRQKVIHCTG